MSTVSAGVHHKLSQITQPSNQQFVFIVVEKSSDDIIFIKVCVCIYHNTKYQFLVETGY